MFLQEHKSKILLLEERISKAKLNYSSTLRHLEQISEEIMPRESRTNQRMDQSNVRWAELSCRSRDSQQHRYRRRSLRRLPRPSDWVDGKEGVANAREWVETHKNSRWVDMGRAEVTRSGSDSLSIISLQTINLWSGKVWFGRTPGPPQQ